MEIPKQTKIVTSAKVGSTRLLHSFAGTPLPAARSYAGMLSKGQTDMSEDSGKF